MHVGPEHPPAPHQPALKATASGAGGLPLARGDRRLESCPPPASPRGAMTAASARGRCYRQLMLIGDLDELRDIQRLKGDRAMNIGEEKRGSLTRGHRNHLSATLPVSEPMHRARWK